MKSLILLLISIFIEFKQIITEDITINGKTYSINVDEAFVILEETEFKSTEFLSQKDKPVFIVKSKLTLGPNINIKKEINEEEIDPEKESLGLYSAIIVLEGGELLIKDSSIETNCKGCNAITVIGKGEVKFYDGNIKTLGDNSAGCFSSYEGNIIVDNVDIETHGKLSPNLIAKNSGKITAINLDLVSLGTDSPLIYSNSDIFTSFSDGRAEKSKMVIIEGESTVVLNNCGLEGNEGVMIFNKREQQGTANFDSMSSSLQLIEKENPLFLITNSLASISLTDSDVCKSDEILINAVCMDEYIKFIDCGGNASVKVAEKTIQGKAFADNKSSISFEFEGDLSSAGITVEGKVKI